MLLGQHDLPATDGWLTAAEAERARGLRFTKRRAEYLLRRWVCKHAVAAAVGLQGDHDSLRRVEVVNLPSGAPAVRLDGAGLGLAVSLTDRAGWAVCMVADRDGPVGCDLERVEPRSPGFVEDFLTEGERAHLAALPEPDRAVTANLVWSAKESALKLLGTGLRRDTRTVEVTVAPAAEPGAWARLAVRTSERGEQRGWWRREGAFVLTVVSERQTPPPTELAGSARLRSAEPVEAWLARPLAP